MNRSRLVLGELIVGFGDWVQDIGGAVFELGGFIVWCGHQVVPKADPHNIYRSNDEIDVEIRGSLNGSQVRTRRAA